jgi:hypothetical protein
MRWRRPVVRRSIGEPYRIPEGLAGTGQHLLCTRPGRPLTRSWERERRGGGVATIRSPLCAWPGLLN